MKTILAFPPPDQSFRNMEGGYGDDERTLQPPPSGLASIACTLVRDVPDCSVSILPAQVLGDGGDVSYRELSGVVGKCKDADCLGISCRYDNQAAAIAFANQVRRVNDRIRIVLGGANMWSTHMTQMVLANVPSIDAVIRGAGGLALSSYLRGDSPFSIPHLAYRGDGQVICNPVQSEPLNDLPIWDFRHVENPLHPAAFSGSAANGGNLDLAPCVESNRGCCKATRTEACPYCVSARSPFSTFSPEHFMGQLAHLYATYGMDSFFVADNIFTTSLQRIQALQREKERRSSDLPSDLKLRVYLYPTDLQQHGEEMASGLQKLGVREAFIGLETLDAEIAQSLKKSPLDAETVAGMILLLKRFGIATKVAFLLGLPGESPASLRQNEDGLKRLLDVCAANTGEGGLKSVDVSRVMPLIGTEYYGAILNDPDACSEYEKTTGKRLCDDICPDYGLLFALLARRTCSAGMEQIEATGERMIQTARSVLNPQKVGGYWRPKNGKY